MQDRASGRHRATLDLARWLLFGAVGLLLVAIVQSLRHPARLWSPGLMGRVLAWDVEPTRPPGEGSAAR